MNTIHIIKPGVLPYGQALALQLELRERLLASLEDRPSVMDPAGYVICLQHPPTITLGKRGSAADLISPALLQARGFEVFEIDRGGEATCHEPGQLVVYPILPIKHLGIGVVDLVRNLAGCLALAAAPFGAELRYDTDNPGLWTTGESPKKMASVGMRIRSGVSTHGAAINVTNTLEGFKLIVPCGMPDAPMCTLRQVIGEDETSDDALFEALIARFLTHFQEFVGLDFEPGQVDLPDESRWLQPLSIPRT